MSSRRIAFVMLACAGSLSCHRSVPQDALPDVIDAGMSTFPDPMADLTPAPVDAGDDASDQTGSAATGDPLSRGLHVEIHQQLDGMMPHTGGPDIFLVVDSAGKVFAQISKPTADHHSDVSGCKTNDIGPSGVAKIIDAVTKNGFFSLPNAFGGPTDSGRTSIAIRLDGKSRELVFMGGLQGSDAKQRLNRVKETIMSSTGANAWGRTGTPLGKCPSNADAHFHF